MGLLLGLQIGVTFSEIRGYTFGVFGGRIEGEGTIGFVEVIKEYRRLGIAQALEQYLMQKLIAENEIIYLQVEVDNYPSMRLHEKLGYERSDDIITWYM